MASGTTVEGGEYFGRRSATLTFVGVVGGAVIAALLLLPVSVALSWLGLGGDLGAGFLLEAGSAPATAAHALAGMAIVTGCVIWCVERETGARPHPLRAAVILTVSGVVPAALLWPEAMFLLGDSALTPLVPLSLVAPGLLATILLDRFGFRRGGPSKRSVVIACGVLAAAGLVVPAARSLNGSPQLATGPIGQEPIAAPAEPTFTLPFGVVCAEEREVVCRR